MPIDRILGKEKLRLVPYLPRRHSPSPPRRLRFAPSAEQLLVRAPGAQFIVLAQPAKGAEFVVGDAHVCFVGLGGGERLQLRGGDGAEECFEDGQVEVRLRPGGVVLEVGLGDAADGVDVC